MAKIGPKDAVDSSSSSWNLGQTQKIMKPEIENLENVKCMLAERVKA